MTDEIQVIDHRKREVVPVAPVTPAALLQMAVSQGADLAKLEKLMDLQERWEANEAKKAFVVAMQAFHAEAPEISKNKTVKYGQTAYKHATLDHICDLVGSVMAKHGLTFAWDTQQDQNGIRVTCTITHVLGHSQSVSLQAGADNSGSKNSIQAIGSTVSYLQRYTLLSAAGLATGESDDDGKSADAAKPITDAQIKALTDLMAELQVDKAAFLRRIKVNALSELPAAKFQAAKELLETKRAPK
jgi:hypothetical protein